MQRLETCLLIAGADSVLSWSFVSSCDVLNCLFLLGKSLVGNPISDGIVFKTELTHLPLLEA